MLCTLNPHPAIMKVRMSAPLAALYARPECATWSLVRPRVQCCLPVSSTTGAARTPTASVQPACALTHLSEACIVRWPSVASASRTVQYRITSPACVLSSQGRLTNVEFHPTAPVLLAAGANFSLNLFQVCIRVFYNTSLSLN